MVHAEIRRRDDEEEGVTVKSIVYKEGRPKRNSNFLIFLFCAGVAGVVAFAVLAATTQQARTACPCANPYKQIGYEKLLDIQECTKDQTYMACYGRKTRQFTMFAGLAGGSGGLLILALAALYYA